MIRCSAENWSGSELSAQSHRIERSRWFLGLERSRLGPWALKAVAQKVKLCGAAPGATELRFVRGLKRWKACRVYFLTQVVWTQDNLYIQVCDHFTLRRSGKQVILAKWTHLPHFKMDWDVLYINKEGFECTRRWCRLGFVLKRFLGGFAKFQALFKPRVATIGPFHHRECSSASRVQNRGVYSCPSWTGLDAIDLVWVTSKT